METLQAACIGCGNRGRLYSRFAAQSEGLRMRAYSDSHSDSAEAALGAFGGKYATTDPDRIFNDDSIDMVFICTWHDSHRPLVVAAADAGKHILVEKPLALTVEDALAMEAVVRNAGVHLVVGHKMRWAPVVREVKRRIPQPRFLMGQVMDDRWPDDLWAQQPVIGGGNVLSQGCHMIDLLHAFAGADPVRVTADGIALTHPNAAVPDQVAATVRYGNGTVATVVMGDAGTNPVTTKFFLQLWDGAGNGACLHERCHRADLWGAEAVTLRAEDLSASSKEDPEGNRALLEALVRAIRTGEPALPGVREGRVAIQTLEAILRAVHTGESQAISA